MSSDDDLFSDDYAESSPLPSGLQRSDSNTSWRPLSQEYSYISLVFLWFCDCNIRCIFTWNNFWSVMWNCNNMTTGIHWQHWWPHHRQEHSVLGEPWHPHVVVQVWLLLPEPLSTSTVMFCGAGSARIRNFLPLWQCCCSGEGPACALIWNRICHDQCFGSVLVSVRILIQLFMLIRIRILLLKSIRIRPFSWPNFFS